MKPKISIITATRNVVGTIEALYASIAEQTYENLEWIVADGGSSDGTLHLLRQFADSCHWVHFVSEPDFGIYHAINKAISRSTGEFYLVIGADDLLDAEALQNFVRYIGTDAADVILARVIRAGKIIGGFRRDKAWLGPSRIFRGSHSVGTLIRRSLHERFGYYSNRFPLLADVYFLKVLLRSGEVHFIDAPFTAGTFTEGGATTGNQLQLLAENWQIQMLTEPSPLLQTVLFFNKILARYRVMTSELQSKARQKRIGK